MLIVEAKTDEWTLIIYKRTVTATPVIDFRLLLNSTPTYYMCFSLIAPL